MGRDAEKLQKDEEVGKLEEFGDDNKSPISRFLVHRSKPTSPTILCLATIEIAAIGKILVFLMRGTAWSLRKKTSRIFPLLMPSASAFILIPFLQAGFSVCAFDPCCSQESADPRQRIFLRQVFIGLFVS